MTTEEDAPNWASDHDPELLSLADDLALDPSDERTIREAVPRALHTVLNSPYSTTQWSDDLRAMGSGATTGFDVLDELRMRWLPGKLTAVVARPGGGKTAFMLEACVRYLELNPESRAVFLSWEEPLADVVSRLVQRADAVRSEAAARSDGDTFIAPQLLAETIRTCGRGEQITPSDLDRVIAARRDVDMLLQRLYLVDGDQVGRNVTAVLTELAAWMRSPNAPRIGLVCVDYFQKLSGSPEAYTRQTQLADVADTLRRFAKGAALSGSDVGDAVSLKYAVPVIVGAQVNRTTLQSDGSGHPTGDTIREADDLLNDASAVIALSWEKSPHESGIEAVRWLRMTVPKHRGGRARGTFPGDDVARILWYPARSWISSAAKRSAEDSTEIEWAPVLAGSGDSATSRTARGVAKDAAAELKAQHAMEVSRMKVRHNQEAAEDAALDLPAKEKQRRKLSRDQEKAQLALKQTAEKHAGSSSSSDGGMGAFSSAAEDRKSAL